jgi:hypothetical protein
LVNGFIDQLYTRLGTTSTYKAITRAQAKSSQSVFTSRFLVTDLNNGDSSASVVTPLPVDYQSTSFFYCEKKCKYKKKRPRQCPSGPLQHILINILFYYSGLPAITPQLVILLNHPLFSASLEELNSTTEIIAPTVLVITSRHGPHSKHRSSIVACVFVAAGTCLPSHCPETLFFGPSSGRCVATAVHATIYFSVH